MKGSVALKKSTLFRFWNFWPPFVGAGIKITHVAADFRTIDVEMKLHFWNKNYVGTQFGGSLYAMTDPFFMVILIESLGPDYSVWDKAASIRFKKPGRGRVRGRFHLTDAQIAEVKLKADTDDKYEPTYTVYIFNDANEVVAEVDKLVSVKRRDKIRHR
jgi:hypothetical protein